MSGPLHLERAAAPSVPWDDLDRRPDRTISQTRAWLDFLVESQAAEPVVARVFQGREQVGWFTGATTRRAGLRFLGAPLRGWTTAAMGFNLDDGVDRTAAYAALPSFAFGELGCIHLELADRALTDDAAVPPGFAIAHLGGYELDLASEGTPIGDDALLAGMTAHGRRDVRRALRNGITVEAVPPTDPTFVQEYYGQVSEAFAKRGLVPTYPVERVAALVRHLGPTGRLVLLRARTPDGDPAATGIFPGLPGGTAEYWMGASHRRHQHLLPNEALMWTALRTWRDRGAVRFNFGGGGTYKAKYGGAVHHLPWVRRSRLPALELGRQLALDLQRRRQRRGRTPSPR
ncbi:GNAT family N-acetyltransferase [Aquihabitans sp. G128]|uniref:GNAT family N-acetyltransferase n=1 Tax=Aquihabitans sp. G128 TaxID=2849779 RepID=UPI001C22CB4F|nr:GNAT family N-acetyltransferase [Aquihabitans sp. G128]QXC61491.1 GNAT family N-acetyltransferase [Aquihabitans sp. G128]